jgi:hypothetical protein
MPFVKGGTPWNKGKDGCFSVDALEKMSANNVQRRQAPWNKGKHHTAETVEKIRASNLGSKGSNWQGGRKMQNGYIFINCPEHPYRNSNNCVAEHRLIIEKIIGRFLDPVEEVHHINKVKTDNLPKNLIVFNGTSAHQSFEAGNHVSESYIVFDGRKLNRITHTS